MADALSAESPRREFGSSSNDDMRIIPHQGIEEITISSSGSLSSEDEDSCQGCRTPHISFNYRTPAEEPAPSQQQLDDPHPSLGIRIGPMDRCGEITTQAWSKVPPPRHEKVHQISGPGCGPAPFLGLWQILAW